VLTPVAIETQPQDVSIAENAQFELSVNATGSGEKSYRWYLDETLIEGASEATYSISQASSTQAGTYHVVVSNGASSIKSNAAQVVVVAPPVITSFLVSPDVTLVGSSITMSAAASGDGPFTFKWHKGDALLATTDLPIYSITEAAESDSGTYTVHVSSTVATVVSEPVSLQVLTPVGIETQPQDAIVMERTPLELSVATVGSGELSFNWYLNDTPIEGATSAVYTVANATFADIGQYHVVVSNGASSAQSEKANILVTPFIEPPSIVIQPQSKRANPGEPSSMVVLAKGASPISYQWKLNGEEIAGAVGSFYLINAVGEENIGTYTVVISNEAASIESNPADLSLIVPLSITSQSADLTVTPGDSFQLSVTLSMDDIQESYWAKDGERIPDASALSYVVTSANLQDAGSYTFHVSDGTGWLQSTPITLTVNQPPVFTTTPENRTVVDGQRAMLQWIAEGAAPLTYELLLAGSVVDSNNNGSFWITPSGEEDTTLYTVTVSNAFGSITSQPVSVSLEQSNPQILYQPRDIRLVLGERLNIGLKASGGSLKYQWYKGAAPVGGASAANYVVEQTQAVDAGDYFVVISNDKGVQASLPIKVSFGARLSVALDGANLTFAVDPGTSDSNWKLQRSSNLLFWEDVQALSAQDLEGLEMPVGDGSVFYRVVSQE
jgi:hypothetical protein